MNRFRVLLTGIAKSDLQYLTERDRRVVHPSHDRSVQRHIDQDRESDRSYVMNRDYVDDPQHWTCQDRDDDTQYSTDRDCGMNPPSHYGPFTLSIDQDRERGQGNSTDQDPEGDSQYWICQDRKVISHLPDGSFELSVDQDRESHQTYGMDQDLEADLDRGRGFLCGDHLQVEIDMAETTCIHMMDRLSFPSIKIEKIEKIAKVNHRVRLVKIAD
ncbi:unnamed protein product [Peronospora destructor]|uniref:Uncharacterized protein n=1 Tax=Peronospora destructor TaxID=86335 RepID=A0AAV0V828_9STRA|nr:unnamed protein product [Peronospora destructor]